MCPDQLPALNPKRLLLICGLALVALSAAQGQEMPESHPESIDAEATSTPTIDQLENLVQQGRWDEAWEAVQALRMEEEGEPRFDLLYGIVLLARGEPDAAIFPLERTVLMAPANLRARLELGRAYFEVGRWDDARAQFQRVQSSNPPPNVQANVDRFLAAIEREEDRQASRWQGTVSLAGSYNGRNNIGEESLDSGFTVNIEDETDYRLRGQVDVRREFQRSNFVSDQVGVRLTGSLAANGDLEFTSPDIGLRAARQYQRGAAGYSASLEALLLSKAIQARLGASRTLSPSVETFVRYEPRFTLDGPVNEQWVNRLTVGADFSQDAWRHRTTVSAQHLYNLRSGDSDENTAAERNDLINLSANYRLQYLLNPQWALSLTPSVTYTRWRENNPLYPLVGDDEPRQDLTARLQPGVTWQPRPWLYTQANAGYAVRKSNINIYDNTEVTALISAAVIW